MMTPVNRQEIQAAFDQVSDANMALFGQIQALTAVVQVLIKRAADQLPPEQVGEFVFGIEGEAERLLATTVYTSPNPEDDSKRRAATEKALNDIFAGASVPGSATPGVMGL